MRRLFEESSLKYTSLTRDGIYCSGKSDFCSSFEIDGAKIIPWGDSINDSEYDKIKELYIMPSFLQLKSCNILHQIKELTKLHFLYLSYPYLFCLEENSLPKDLLELTIGYEYDMEEYVTSTFNSKVVFSQINKVSFYGDYTDTGVNTLLKVPNIKFPNIEILSTDVDRRGKVLSLLKDFNHLVHVELTRVGNVDIFKYIPESVLNLGITNAGAKFRFIDILEKKNIQTLWLNNVNTEIDCSVFKLLPEIKEINLLNIKNIKNIESLFDCERLISFYSFNCPLIKEKAHIIKQQNFMRCEIL